MHHRTLVCVASLTAGVLFAGTAGADELVYKPTNPAFGGNSFNSDYLFRSADLQNKFATGPAERDIAEDFVRSLQSRLLSALSSEVVDAIFGDDPQDQGTVIFGDQTITFVRGLESITLTIINTTTGETTTIEVPTLVVEPGG